MALIVAVLAAASSGYLWYRGQQRIADLDSRINTVEKGLQNNVQKVVMPKLASMHDQLNKFSQRTDQLSQKLDQRQQQIAQLQQTIQHVQTQNKQLSDQLGGDHGRFVEQRIALLLEAANQRLQVERDPKGAAQALSLADQAIQQSGDPELHPVRAKIANEMAALNALPNPDIEGMSLKLSNAIQQIPKLPLKSNVPNSYQSQSADHGGAAASGDNAGNGQDNGPAEFAGIKLAKKWHQFVDSVGNALSRMVTIRRANGTQNAPALMAPDQSYFLVQNLQLQLRTARLALLSGNAQTYDDALSEARDWIRKYFDTSDSSVSGILNDLSQLSHVKLNWQAPDLSASLNTLRQIMNRDRNNGGGASSAGAGQSGQSGSSNGGATETDHGKPSDSNTDNANAAGSS
ncbi:MAG: uroporphyrinogen-III C-methyltransferase [Salinisphaera sp.]|uniref:uroporphyrinogen-III C-methyltransferase n=1 Tax=Salinisphaera sp. TaxID=1914330 RepID=UPI003C7C74C1